MTFKDVQKAVQAEAELIDTKANIDLIDKLQGLPFWIFDQDQHKFEYRRTKAKCCFWHSIKPPQKDGHDMPVLPYQRTLYDALQNYKRIAILKSRGIGCSEFLLRYIAWCCINKYATDSNTTPRVLILTGPRIQLSQDLIARFKALLKYLPETEKTVAIVKNVRVESFPSFHCSAARGYTDVRFIMVDEAAFWPPHQVSEMMGVVSGYISKPNAQSQIVFCSSPNRPGDMMHQIFSEREEDSLYHRLKFDYRFGLEGPYPIYSQQEIDEAMRSREFEREMNLQFLGQVGTCFSQYAIDRAVELGNKYGDTINKNAKHSLGVDPGFSSSSTGLVCLEYSDGIIKVVYADEVQKPSFNAMIQKIWEIRNMVGILSNLYIDGVNVEFVEACKQELGEDSDWYRIHERIAWCKKNSLNVADYMQVVPVSFGQEGPKMLAHCKNLLEHEDSLIAINSKWEKLIVGLRGAIATEYRLEKTESPHSDLIDGFRLAAKFFALNKD